MRTTLPFYRRGWFLTALCLFVPFIGIPMIWLMNPRPLGKAGTLGLTAVGVFVAIGSLLDPGGTMSDKQAGAETAPSEVITAGVEADGPAGTYVTPTVGALNVREGPPGWLGEKGKVGQVRAGDSLRVESEDDRWLEVFDAASGSKLGWVHGDYVTDLRPGLADSLRASLEERERRAAQARAKSEEAIRAVAAGLGPNKLGVEPRHLLTKENPRGEGTFVYVGQTRFGAMERFVMWLVIDGQAYAFNSPTKGLTPAHPWPREASSEAWSRTGLDRYSAAGALEIVFGES